MYTLYNWHKQERVTYNHLFCALEKYVDGICCTSRQFLRIMSGVCCSFTQPYWCIFVFKENIKTSATESVGLHEMEQHKPWFVDECLSFLDQRKQAKM